MLSEAQETEREDTKQKKRKNPSSHNSKHTNQKKPPSKILKTTKKSNVHTSTTPSSSSSSSSSSSTSSSSRSSEEKSDGKQYHIPADLYKPPNKSLSEQEEDQKVLDFKIVVNDGTEKTLCQLLKLKDIFSKQLPKMPKEYITRLVFGWRHRSLAILKQGKVVGGISFRPFPTQGFIEIAFCAITRTEQVKGYGTRLMNQLKSFIQKDGIYYFLTYADNFAVGYFKKQGFTTYITLAKEKWGGYIKDYEGGTLMECHIQPKLPYLSIPSMIAKQRACVNDKIRSVSNCLSVYEGISFESGRVKIEDIPGITEVGWAYGKKKFEVKASDKELKCLQESLASVLKSLMESKDSWPFLEPVDPEAVEDYYEVIKNPIDFSIMEKRMKTGHFYITKHIFEADIKRLCENCRMYNRQDTPYYYCANSIEKLAKNLLRDVPEVLLIN